MKKLFLGMTLLYTLTASEKKSYKKSVLPAVVVDFNETSGEVDLEVLGTGGLLVDGVKNIDAVDKKEVEKGGFFSFSNQ